MTPIDDSGSHVEGAALPLRRSEERAVLVASQRSAQRRRRLVRTVRLQTGGPRGTRYLAAYPTAGPKVRLGVAWFALALAAVWLGAGFVALLYGSAGAIAAVQGAAAWRRRRRPVAIPIVAVSAFALAMFAVGGPRLLGIGALAVVAVAAGTGWLAAQATAPTAANIVIETAQTLRVGFCVGLGGGALVLLRHGGRSGALLVLLMVSAFEAGDYLVGSGAGNHFEGPLAGAIGIGVVTFALSVVEPSPWHAATIWWLGALGALTCPIGLIAGSLILPHGQAFAPGVRRLDALLVFGPVAVVLTQLAL